MRFEWDKKQAKQIVMCSRAYILMEGAIGYACVKKSLREGWHRLKLPGTDGIGFFIAVETNAARRTRESCCNKVPRESAGSTALALRSRTRARSSAR